MRNILGTVHERVSWAQRKFGEFKTNKITLTHTWGKKESDFNIRRKKSFSASDTNVRLLLSEHFALIN